MTGTPWPLARALAHGCAAPLAATPVDLTAAVDCVLAEPLWSLVPMPPFDTAAMDGWAVRGPGPWQVVGDIRAGATAAEPLADGTAVGVATGSAVPIGTEAVVPVERGVRLGSELTGQVSPGRHVRRTGEEAPARTALLPAGTLLSSAAVGLAAAAGHDALRVHPRPRVHALVTGEELLRAGLPGDGRVRDAVGPGMASAVASYGGVLAALDYLGDDADLLAKAIAAADADLIVTTGASSVGAADFLAAALAALRAEIVVDGVLVRPGHPQVLARLPGGRPVVGLPGNPLAALAGMVTLLGPLLAGLSGRPLPVLGEARSTEALGAAAGAHRLLPVRCRDGLAQPTGHAGSAMLRGAAVADAFAVLAPDTDVAAGDPVPLVPLP
jgi:molybdopterin molybdotransferase